MNRRILYIIFGAIAFIALVVLLWMWFLDRPAPQPKTTGSFGTAPSSQTTSGTGGSIGNIPGTIAQNQTTGSIGGTLPGVQGSGAGKPASGALSGGGSVFDATAGGYSAAEGSAPGAQWFLGPPTPGASGASIGLGTDFNPKTVNQLNTGTIGGTPGILGNTVGGSGTSGSGIGLEGALIGAGIGTALCTAGLFSNNGVSAITGGAGGTAVATGLDAAAVPVRATGVVTQLGITNTIAGSQAIKENFLDCVTRTIAKAALQQITASVVNWINSGFNGSPSFVTNYQQFFQNVADVAAGEYIKGSGLAFLCSPFQLQIRIALAKSYASRNSAMSCSLSKVVGNINSFMNGNFSQGGWPGLLQFTTVPTNNPYGAYAYAQIGLQSAQNNAYTNANRNMTATGFLNFQQPYDCKPAQNGGNPSCKYKTVTPGSVIESSLASTLGTSQRTLEQAGVSGSFDAIINALITQLMTRTLYSGLSNLSGSTGYQSNFLTPAEQQAQSEAQGIMTALQGDVLIAQQYGEVAQGSIGDIQNVQQQLGALRSCWQGWATGSGLSAEKVAQAAARAEAASTTILQLDQQVDAYNATILRANTTIVALQALQTQALNVASPADVQALAAAYNSAKASGIIFTQSDTTSAQQNRTTLQANLASISTKTSDESAQCYAFAN